MMTESRQPKMPGELFRLAISVMLFVSSYLYASTIAAAASNEDLAAQAYTEARESIRAQRYKDALRQLRTLQKNYPSFQNIAGVKTRIAVLHEADLAGSELSNFSPLVDDAMYLMAYMQVMERFDYAAARIQIAELKTRLPETAYLDAAQYLNAIALEQSGQTASAVDAFQELRDKHTSVNLPFGFSVARGNVMSRYWFDRADRRLKMLADQQQQSAQLTHSRAVSDEELHLDVTIAGKPVTLILRQSALTSTAAWRTGLLNDSLPPSVSVLAGEVKGEADSWARVVLSERAIHGVASIGGKQYRLHPEDLIGTLDYYQPKHRAGVAVKLGGSAKELPMLLDSLPAPPLPDRGLGEQRSNRNGSRAVVNNPTDTRIVPLSIVIDSQYNRYYGGNALTHTLNALNVADAIYAPMGLALRIDESVVIQDTESDPMAIGPTKLETMLRNFRDYRQGKQTLFDDSALVYLFTGNAKTDITLGLAWIDTACRNDGFDVGVTTPTSFADVLLTHELGHSLGAHHDTDTTCSNMAGKLMSPRISARTESSFTSCSQDSINASKQRSCLYDAVGFSMFTITILCGV